MQVLPLWVARTPCARRTPRHELAQLPFPIATHISTPLVLPDGKVYGTLCAFNLAHDRPPDPEHLFKLKLVARLTAQRLVHLRETRPAGQRPEDRAS